MENGISNISKQIINSDKAYKKLKWIRHIIIFKFKPIILHKENLNIGFKNGCVIAPNHQSTLDPLIITSIINKNIHWAALKRFFDAKDSIFNNSKNPILCKATAKLFKKLEYFPIERKSDNPKATNMKSIKNMLTFLKKKQYIGIFPEGTTNKTNADFGNFDKGFIHIAQKTDADIMPITLLWINENKMSRKVIINIGTPFKTGILTANELYEKYVNIQKQQMKENKTIKKSLIRK